MSKRSSASLEVTFEDDVAHTLDPESWFKQHPQQLTKFLECLHERFGVPLYKLYTLTSCLLTSYIDATDVELSLDKISLKDARVSTSEMPPKPTSAAAAASPEPARVQCSAITVTKKQCENMTRDPSGRCKKHQPRVESSTATEAASTTTTEARAQPASTITPYTLHFRINKKDEVVYWPGTPYVVYSLQDLTVVCKSVGNKQYDLTEEDVLLLQQKKIPYRINHRRTVERDVPKDIIMDDIKSIFSDDDDDVEEEEEMSYVE
jgi:hypothetical protein